MKIGIYNSSIDNFELGLMSAGTLADALTSKHQTEMVVHEDSPARDETEAICQKNLPRVVFRTITNSPGTRTDPTRPDRRYEALRAWSDELTRRYDLFINFADHIPLYNSAQRGVLVVQFPHDFVPRPYRAFWQQHLATYQLTIANSYFTNFWTKLLWDIDCPVVYPPVPGNVTNTNERTILTATAIDSMHKQLGFIDAFVQLRQQAPEWQMKLIVKVDGRQRNKRYLQQIEAMAADKGVSVHANPTPLEQADLLRRARMLWHASGESEFDLVSEPLNAIVLRAMAAGCVPLVNNTGALSEVVRHNENGFFWNDTGKLIEYTLKLVQDDSRRLKLSQAARRRMLDFRPEQYADAFQKQLESAFGIPHQSMANPAQLWKRLLRVISGSRFRTI
jgi:glycosyltransferase involved in cell wall biosynthesis